MEALRQKPVCRVNPVALCLAVISKDWASYLGRQNPVNTMNRRGKCHDYAVAESFFHLLKRQHVGRKKNDPAMSLARTCSKASHSFTTRNAGT